MNRHGCSGLHHDECPEGRHLTLKRSGPKSKNIRHLRLFVLGDHGAGIYRHSGREKTGQQEIAAVMEKLYERAKGGYHLQLTVGDFLYTDRLNYSNYNTMFKRYFLDQYRLPLPWLAALGNHEYNQICPNYLINRTYHWTNRTSKSKSPDNKPRIKQRGDDYKIASKGAMTLSNYRWILPARYWSSTIPISRSISAMFIFLDTTPIVRLYQKPHKKGQKPMRDCVFRAQGWRETLHGQFQQTHEPRLWTDITQQLEWFENTLDGIDLLDRNSTVENNRKNNSQIRWIYIIGHHPIYSNVHSPKGFKHAAIMQDLVYRIIIQYNKKWERENKPHRIQGYLCGHEHNTQFLYDRQNRISHLLTGGAGAPIDGEKPMSNSKIRSMTRFIENQKHALYDLKIVGGRHTQVSIWNDEGTKIFYTRILQNGMII